MNDRQIEVAVELTQFMVQQSNLREGTDRWTGRLNEVAEQMATVAGLHDDKARGAFVSAVIAAVHKKAKIPMYA